MGLCCRVRRLRSFVAHCLVSTHLNPSSWCSCQVVGSNLFWDTNDSLTNESATSSQQFFARSKDFWKVTVETVFRLMPPSRSIPNKIFFVFGRKHQRSHCFNRGIMLLAPNRQPMTFPENCRYSPGESSSRLIWPQSALICLKRLEHECNKNALSA